MRHIANLLIALIAALHLYIAWFEIFAWTTRGPRVFANLPADLFEPTTAMAANQGIYNSFLAAGLIWALCIREPLWRFRVAACFLIFVAVAGIFGAATVSQNIFFVQTVPASAAVICAFFGYRKAA